MLIIISILSFRGILCKDHAPSMYMGNIQFPTTIPKTPAVRIYFAGSKIAGKSDDEHKKISFSINPIHHHSPLYLLIIDQVQWHADENTIKYLKVNPKKPYRLYQLEFNGINNSWTLKEEQLESNGQIPDNTVIAIINPQWVSKIEGGNAVTLPTIYLHQNLVDLVGSEAALLNSTQTLLIGAIDSDSIHKKREQIIKRQCKIKTVLALTT